MNILEMFLVVVMNKHHQTSWQLMAIECIKIRIGCICLGKARPMGLDPPTGRIAKPQPWPGYMLVTRPSGWYLTCGLQDNANFSCYPKYSMYSICMAYIPATLGHFYRKTLVKIHHANGASGNRSFTMHTARSSDNL